MSRLRKVLPEGLIEGQTDGYRLLVEPDVVDAVRFERLVGRARDDEGRQRVRRLREALDLWRGAAMQDVGLADSAALDAAVTRLERLRLTATEDRFDVEISLGHGPELVAELTDLVAAHPVRERLVSALMRALAATGRDNEALLVYQRTSEALADALGVDPRRSCRRCTSRCCGRVGAAGGDPQDQPACRAEQLHRQGRGCRRGRRTRLRTPAHDPDRAGWLGKDPARHRDRAQDARRPAGRRLAGGAGCHRRGR
ncbi:AfsR/SARP family transcriptional regulator [Micromonospora sp. M12]